MEAAGAFFENFGFLGKKFLQKGKNAIVMEVGKTRGEWIARSAKMHQQLKNVDRA